MRVLDTALAKSAKGLRTSVPIPEVLMTSDADQTVMRRTISGG